MFCQLWVVIWWLGVCTSAWMCRVQFSHRKCKQLFFPSLFSFLPLPFFLALLILFCSLILFLFKLLCPSLVSLCSLFSVLLNFCSLFSPGFFNPNYQLKFSFSLCLFFWGYFHFFISFDSICSYLFFSLLLLLLLPCLPSLVCFYC